MINYMLDRLAQRVITSIDKRGFANLTGKDLIFKADTYSDTHSFAEKGYNGNVYVYSAIKQKAGWAGAIPWCVYEVKDEKAHQQYHRKSYLQNKNLRTFRDIRKKAYELTESHPLNMVLQEPNKAQSATEYNTGLFILKDIAGETFEIGIPDDENSSEFYRTFLLDPWDMKVIPGDDFQNPIAGYKSVKNLADQNIQKHQILHSKYFNPDDFYRGLSPIQPALSAVLENTALTNWMQVLAENNGYTKGVVNFEEGVGSEDVQAVQDSLLEQKRDQNLAGVPQVLGGAGKMTYVSFGMNTRDAQALQHIQMSANQIALALNWPTELMGDSSQKTHANFQQAVRYAYQSAIIPLLDDRRDELNRFHRDGLCEDGKYYIDYDLSGVEALQDEMNELSQRVVREWQADLITLGEARDKLGMDQPDDPMLSDMRYSDLRLRGMVADVPEM